MNKPLKDIASIRMGYTVRERTGSDGVNGEVPVLMPRDIENEKITSIKAHLAMDEITQADRHILVPGELLIANKGLRFPTFLYRGAPSPCLASASFFVIRVNDEMILPEFLQWYFQQQHVKDYLVDKSKSTVIPSLAKPVLSDLSIPVPSMEVQQKARLLISEIADERDRLEALIEKRRELQDSFINELLRAGDHV